MSSSCSREKLLKNGFIECSDFYLLRRNLYNHIIIMDLKIYKDNSKVEIDVNDMDTKTLYIPYYNRQEQNIHNVVLEEVDKKISNITKDLVEKGILDGTN